MYAHTCWIGWDDAQHGTVKTSFHPSLVQFRSVLQFREMLLHILIDGGAQPFYFWSTCTAKPVAIIVCRSLADYIRSWLSFRWYNTSYSGPAIHQSPLRIVLQLLTPCCCCLKCFPIAQTSLHCLRIPACTELAGTDGVLFAFITRVLRKSDHFAFLNFGFASGCCCVCELSILSWSWISSGAVIPQLPSEMVCCPCYHQGCCITPVVIRSAVLSLLARETTILGPWTLHVTSWTRHEGTHRLDGHGGCCKRTSIPEKTHSGSNNNIPTGCCVTPVTIWDAVLPQLPSGVLCCPSCNQGCCDACYHLGCCVAPVVIRGGVTPVTIRIVVLPQL